MMNDALGDRRSETCHPVSQPLGNAAPVERKIGNTRSFHLLIVTGICNRSEPFDSPVTPNPSDIHQIRAVNLGPRTLAHPLDGQQSQVIEWWAVAKGMQIAQATRNQLGRTLRSCLTHHARDAIHTVFLVRATRFR